MVNVKIIIVLDDINKDNPHINKYIWIIWFFLYKHNYIIITIVLIKVILHHLTSTDKKNPEIIYYKIQNSTTENENIK